MVRGHLSIWYAKCRFVVYRAEYPHSGCVVLHPLAEPGSPNMDERAPSTDTGRVGADSINDDLQGTRIRDDLWNAVIDYASGKTYVLDPESGLAAPESGDPALPRSLLCHELQLPTGARNSSIRERLEYSLDSVIASAHGSRQWTSIRPAGLSS